MRDTVKVPDPVKERVDSEAEHRGISRGAVIEDWMHKADRLDDLLGDFRDSVQTRGDAGP